MIDWTESMSQTFEYYKVLPETWTDIERLEYVSACTINRDSEASTEGSASFEVADTIDETYIRAYLVASQNGEEEKVPLGTFLTQAPGYKFDGKVTTRTLDAYTPLIELKEKLPPIGYTIKKNENILYTASRIADENMRAPIVITNTHTKRIPSDFVANMDDTWLSFLSDFISNANYRFTVDTMGHVLLEPIPDRTALKPVWTYRDDNSSILLPDISDERDLFGIPNVVEVVYTKQDTNEPIIVTVKNEDAGSATSIKNRGREIMYRDTNPNISYNGPTERIRTYVEDYAKKLLRSLSSVEHTVTYSHGYCPVRVGDAVILDYRKAGLNGVIAVVKSQTISCTTGCVVEETATYSTELWKG